MKYYIIAGEASGDLHGSNLLKALKAKDSQAQIRFWGGDQMQAIADAGGVANMAGGGIAGIRKPDAIPPESGPNPQGLENLKYYVTNT